MKRGRAVFSLILAIVLLIWSAGFPLARAQQNDTSQGLQVSPVVIDLNGEKSEDYTLKVTITNITPGVMDVKTSVNDFTSDGTTGNPKVITDDSETTPYSLKSWVSMPSNFTLKSKESKTISVQVMIPGNAEPGGHYGVIRFSGLPPDQSSSQVSLNASVGVLLLARVDGTITEELSVKDMIISKNGKQKGLVATGPVTIGTLVENTGNVHLKPIGTITVKNMFGQVVGSLPFGGDTKNVLPKSTRLFEQEFDKRWMFGRYSVGLEAAYGTNGQVLSGSTSFWVIPIQLILFVVAVGLLLFFGLRFFIRRYNQRVIRKHHAPTRKK